MTSPVIIPPRMIGITGRPASGKKTLATMLATRFSEAVLLPASVIRLMGVSSRSSSLSGYPVLVPDVYTRQEACIVIESGGVIVEIKSNNHDEPPMEGVPTTPTVPPELISFSVFNDHHSEAMCRGVLAILADYRGKYIA